MFLKRRVSFKCCQNVSTLLQTQVQNLKKKADEEAEDWGFLFVFN